MTKVHSHEDSVSYMAVPGLARSLCELGKEADAIALVIDSSQQSTMMRARIMAAARQPDCEVLALLGLIVTVEILNTSTYDLPSRMCTDLGELP